MELLISLPREYPDFFFLFGILFSSFLGLRALFIQDDKIKNENLERMKKGYKLWGEVTGEVAIVHHIQDIIFNFTCSMSGWLAYYFLSSRYSWFFEDFGWPKCTFAIFLIVLSIFGISGQLPPLIFHGKWPRQ